jgi:hypothetical protein
VDTKKVKPTNSGRGEMNVPKRTRSARSKLQKSQLAEGPEFYYSRKPSTKKADYVVAKAKPIAPARSIRVKKSK